MGDDVIGRVEDIVARLAEELAGEIALDGERASVSISAGDLRTLLALARSNSWQDIETAPKDGTPVILLARCKTATASAPVIGWFVNGDWIECCFAPNQPVGLVPTYWMPRPLFPNDRPPSPPDTGE